MSAAHIFLEISLDSLITESGVENQAEFPAANWPQFCVFSLSHKAVIFLLGTWEQIHSLAPLFFVLISLVPIRGCLVAVIQSPTAVPALLLPGCFPRVPGSAHHPPLSSSPAAAQAALSFAPQVFCPEGLCFALSAPVVGACSFFTASSRILTLGKEFPASRASILTFSSQHWSPLRNALGGR